MAEATNYSQQEATTGKVIKGTARVEKKTLTKKVIDFLFSDKLDSIGSYLLKSVLEPGINGLLYSLGIGALNMMFQNRGGGVPTATFTQGNTYQPQPGRRDPVPYDTAYQRPVNTVYYPPMGINDISFDSKDDAWSVIDTLGNAIRQYGKAMLADYYRASGVTGNESNWALQGHGWYSIGNASPRQRIDGRWIIDLPPIQKF